jgi:carbonic anhydrase
MGTFLYEEVPMKLLKQVFDQNEAWAKAQVAEDPAYFDTLAKGQTPKILWIGCADSRVPANQIMGLPPGEVFVHRNVANVVVHSDLNCLSVLQYAVEVLQVEHVIVCGHYGCGGVIASTQSEKHGLIDNWLRHIRDVQRLHQAELEALPEGTPRFNKLVELNVREQVLNVASTTIVQDAWDRGQKLAVHGWVYGLHDGRLRDLGLCLDSRGEIDAIYHIGAGA